MEAEPAVSRVGSIALGDCHTCAVLECGVHARESAAVGAVGAGGALRCWGCGGKGQLGSGSMLPQPQRPAASWFTRRRAAALPSERDAWLAAVPPVDLGSGVRVRAVSAGDEHTCALDTGGQLRCWGAAVHGQTGVGFATASVGESAAEMGRALKPINLGHGAVAVAVSASSHTHVCTLLSTKRVKCFGGNEWGQLGLGDAEHRGDFPAEMGVGLPAVDLGDGAEALGVSVGGHHSCAIVQQPSRWSALLPRAVAKCWGANGWGELGYEDLRHRGGFRGQMGDLLPAVHLGRDRRDEPLGAALELDPHRLPVVTRTPLSVLQLSAGKHFTCAVAQPDAEGGGGAQQPAGGAEGPRLAFCWGANAWGQLGQGDTAPRGTRPGSLGDHLPPIKLAPPRAARGGARVEAVRAAPDGYFACAIVSRAAGGSDLHCWPFPPPRGSMFEDADSHGEEHVEIARHHKALPHPNRTAAAALLQLRTPLHTGQRSVVDVALGRHSLCAVLDDGGLKCYGRDESGNLGYGGRTDQFANFDPDAGSSSAAGVPPDVDVGTCDAPAAPAARIRRAGAPAALPAARQASTRASRAPAVLVSAVGLALGFALAARLTARAMAPQRARAHAPAISPPPSARRAGAAAVALVREPPPPLTGEELL